MSPVSADHRKLDQFVSDLQSDWWILESRPVDFDRTAVGLHQLPTFCTRPAPLRIEPAAASLLWKGQSWPQQNRGSLARIPYRQKVYLGAGPMWDIYRIPPGA